MKISELIAAVGDDQVGVQNLDQCYISANTAGSKRNRHGVISFGVQASQIVDMVAGTESERMALIVWMPRKKVQAVMAAEKEKSDAAERVLTNGDGVLGATRPTYEALALELAELRGRYAADLAMMNERLGERTQGMLAALVRARLAPSAPSFRAGWEASFGMVPLEEAVRAHMEGKAEEVPEAAVVVVASRQSVEEWAWERILPRGVGDGDGHALAGAATGEEAEQGVSARDEESPNQWGWLGRV